MRHHGTSAYSGHYVAEAMDWTTGQWHEFNDETVKLLPKGPSFSYNPCGGYGSGSSGQALDKDFSHGKINSWIGSQEAYDGKKEGSQDAYNMYYVAEEYLARIALESIGKRRETEALGAGNGSKSDVLVNAIKERESKYSILSE